mmetsp:Transcript_60055/g.127206  ORF Transcript_60055/g.127206 Transcript_60055/m.127206 type:complete len:206 (+) Transcript_60055:253-870(+)|eukprot:CAMPEP_0206473268 /NCGR_PEP_ID=MMETSP0324_2-20121206/32745_1 /ASSEMBLY_ACC=CAM_ASM_000836 /TAXON_ID=2866 /ORGANISM="Crypthecodinium cohnii, Strain Seligo" /LENGTH=205 /DNA_ID=CAMNT_0053948127 /DNA_START=179 /DNA_END=796 /DNA_ORIENTATION=-
MAVLCRTTSQVATTLLALLLSWSSSVNASSMHVAALCRGGTCPDPKFPILDFDQEKGECLCRANPCWDNNGVTHACPDGTGYPFLHFTFSQEKELKCSCSKFPVYDSVHLARDLCPGHSCESEAFPILDFDSKENKCFCRSTPCPQKQCSDSEPIVHYREDSAPGSDAGSPVCECERKQEKPSQALRGVPQKETSSCTWNRQAIE